LTNGFECTDADIVGKCARCLYFENGDTLVVQFEDREHCYTDFVAGSAIMIKCEAFDRVPWPTGRVHGEDIEFLLDSVKNGFRIYAADRFNYVAVRRPVAALHTWEITDEEQLRKCRIICDTKGCATRVTCRIQLFCNLADSTAL